MESLAQNFEDALLEDYEEVMEVEAKAADINSSSEVQDMEKSLPDLPAPDAPNVKDATHSDTAVITVVTAPVAPSSSSNPDIVSGVKANSGSNIERKAVVVCRICNKRHQLSACRVFQNMAFEKRLRMVLLHNYCSRCLSHDHVSRVCKSQGQCKKCKGKHHSMLHSNAHASLKKKQTQDAKQTTLLLASNLPIRHMISFSPTVKVYLKVANKSIPVRAVIDLCCSMSYICESLVKTLKLPVSSMDKERISCVQVSSIYDSSQQIGLTVKVKQMKGIHTPVQTVSNAIKEQFAGMQLADPSFNISSRVALVIGPEVAPLILKPRIYSNPGFPLAQYTIFGWVISGQSPF